MHTEIRFKGIATKPDGYSVTDGFLNEAMNLVPESDGMQPIGVPAVLAVAPNGEVAYIHHAGTYTNYICTADGKLTWNGSVIASPGSIFEVTSIGNTLIICGENGVEYAIWRADANDGNGGYSYLGSRPPQTIIQFGLQGTFQSYPSDSNASTIPTNWKKYGQDSDNISGVIDDWIIWNTDFYTRSFPCDFNGTESGRVPYKMGGFSGEKVYSQATQSDFDSDEANADNADATVTVVEQLTNLILGAVNKFIQTKATDKNMFAMPFLVRYAYRLYDGSHTMHSAPVLMVPNSKAPVVWWRADSSIARRHSSKASYSTRCPYVYSRCSANVAKLMMRMISVPKELADWKDIIDGIDIYVSAPLYNYDQSGKVYGWEQMITQANKTYAYNNWTPFYSEGNITNYNAVDTSGVTSRKAYTQRFWYDMQQQLYPNKKYYHPVYRFLVPEKSEADMAKAIKDCGNFYKIASLDFATLTTTEWNAQVDAMKSVEIEKGILKSLTSRERLEDDYKSHYDKTARGAYVYNARVNLCNVGEKINAEVNMPIATMPVSLTSTPTHYWECVVEYVKDGKRVFVKAPDCNIKTGYDADFPRYVFVPDADAKSVYMTRRKYEATEQPAEEATEQPLLDADKPTGGEVFDVAGDIVIVPDINGDNKFKPTDTIIEGDDGTQETYESFEIVPGYDGYKTEDDGYTTMHTGTYRIPLQESEYLNGAVWFKGYSNEALPKSALPDNVTNMIVSNYPNKIYTSDASNPFRFDVRNINTIGTGAIKALRSAVTPVRANQVGQLSMYAFSEDGIWALRVSSTTGGWSGWEIINGDVVTNERAVCQLDNAVCYPTERGVMILQGAQSVCISTLLEGVRHGVKDLPSPTLVKQIVGDMPEGVTDFAKEFCNDAMRIAYDYTNQRVLLANPNYGYAYIYSLATQQWGAMEIDFRSFVFDYPSAYYNSGDGLRELTNPMDYSQEPTVLLLTRPLKCEAPDIIKQLRDVVLRGVKHSEVMGLAVFGSRDCVSWHLLQAVSGGDIRAIRGSGYKYYKIMLKAKMPCDRKLAGATLNWEAKLTNRLR